MLISIILAIFMFVLIEEPFNKISRKFLNGITRKIEVPIKVRKINNDDVYGDIVGILEGKYLFFSLKTLRPRSLTPLTVLLYTTCLGLIL